MAIERVAFDKGDNASPIQLSVPLHWDLDYVDEVLSYEKSSSAIAEFYGCIEPSPFGSGRVSIPHQRIELERARTIIDIVHRSGCRFKYLLNAPDCEESLIDYDSAARFVSFLDQELKVDAVVVSSPKLMEFCSRIAPRLRLHVSTIAGVRSPHDLIPFIPFGPEALVPEHDVPREPEVLARLHRACLDHDIRLELMVTESCLWRCAWRKDHYTAVGRRQSDEAFHARCMDVRRKDPSTLFTCGSFVRPEDLALYHAFFGISRYKLTGRSKSRAHLLHICRCYLSGRSPDNLLELMGMAPVVQGETWLEVAPRAYDGMLHAILDGGLDNVEVGRQYASSALRQRLMSVAAVPTNVMRSLREAYTATDSPGEH